MVAAWGDVAAFPPADRWGRYVEVCGDGLGGEAGGFADASCLSGADETCEFEQGLYLNPGPWRIPYHQRAVLDYCKQLNVALEPFIQLNHNALLHASKAFGGKPQRIREIKTDFQGQVSELLAKAANKGKLEDAVSKDAPFCS